MKLLDEQAWQHGERVLMCRPILPGGRLCRWYNPSWRFTCLIFTRNRSPACAGSSAGPQRQPRVGSISCGRSWRRSDWQFSFSW